ncbi:MAG: hypothetical protein F4Y26_03585 [Gammaproteobacteria bacterium]|nr:hypothetical protein [Gammaproteobacteria bacterium]
MSRALAVVGVVITGCATSILAGPEDFPRTAAGKPDFSGTYDIATLTPYLRDPARGENAFVDPSEAAAAQDRAAGVAAADLAPKSPDRGAPEKGADVGAYNQIWMDPGSTMFQLDGKYPASILVDPPNGRLPQLSDAGKARRATLKQKGWFKNTGTAWWLEEGGAPYDDMETQPLVDRCLYLGVVTVPMQPIVYNNHKVIVQTEDHVLILVEWMHWARVVRLDSEHLPDDIRSLAGDSIGWWEDDTLVVETTNFLFEPGVPREGLRVVERFSPLDAGRLLYRFTVHDPDYVTPYTGEYPWPQTDTSLYEYACHEGNCAMGNTLRGARRLEREWFEQNGTPGHGE